jgi:hypothetical protein
MKAISDTAARQNLAKTMEMEFSKIRYLRIHKNCHDFSRPS